MLKHSSNNYSISNQVQPISYPPGYSVYTELTLSDLGIFGWTIKIAPCSCKLHYKIPKVSTKASAGLQLLSKHLVLPDVVVSDRPPGKLHGLLKMVLPDLRHTLILLHILCTNNYT